MGSWRLVICGFVSAADGINVDITGARDVNVRHNAGNGDGGSGVVDFPISNGCMRRSDAPLKESPAEAIRVDKTLCQQSFDKTLCSLCWISLVSGSKRIG